ncbi:DUF4238 domain-containing protein [bacterium]|nr:DUF4238 domain-containing protein [bacterium]
MNEPIRQHTVPICYLRRFSSNGSQVNEFRSSKGQWITNSLKNASVQKHMYTMIDEGGKDYCVEYALSDLETKANPVLHKVDSMGLIGISEDDRRVLADFITVQHYRTKRMRKFSDVSLSGYQDPQAKMKFLEESLEQLREAYSDAEIEDYRQRISDNDEPIDNSEFYLRSIMFSVSPRVRDCIFQMHWRTETSRQAHPTGFVSSDVPFAIRTPGKLFEKRHVRLAEAAAEFYFPISTRTMLIGSNNRKKNSRKRVTHSRVDELNKVTLVNHDCSLYSASCHDSIELILNSLNGFRVPDMESPF